MKKSIVFSILIFSFCAANSQQKTSKAELETLITRWDNTSELSESQRVATSTRLLSEKSKDWVAAYWASFYYSQVGRASKVPAPYLDSAQLMIENSIKIKQTLTRTDSVSFLALQSLIYSLKSSANTGADDWKKKQKDALNKALRIDKNSPLLLTLTAIDLVNESGRDLDYRKLQAARIVFEESGRKFKANPKQSPTSITHWNEGWVQVWLKRLENI